MPVVFSKTSAPRVHRQLRRSGRRVPSQTASSSELVPAVIRSTLGLGLTPIQHTHPTTRTEQTHSHTHAYDTINTRHPTRFSPYPLARTQITPEPELIRVSVSS